MVRFSSTVVRIRTFLGKMVRKRSDLPPKSTTWKFCGIFVFIQRIWGHGLASLIEIIINIMKYNLQRLYPVRLGLVRLSLS